MTELNKELNEEVVAEDLTQGEDTEMTVEVRGEDTPKAKKFPTKKVVMVGGVAVLAGTAVVAAKKVKAAKDVADITEKTGVALKASQFMGKSLHVMGKHAPLMLTAAGIVGLGATAYFSYKAKSRVEEIVDDIEERRDNDEEVSRFEIVRGITGAIALPVVTGTLSVAAIGASYLIMNNRVTSLAGALAASTAENEYFRRKYIAQHSEAEYNEFMNTEEETVKSVDDNGEVTEETKIARVSKERLSGRWFSESTQFTTDDHEYNMAFIQSKIDELDLKMFRRGNLTLNEVLDALGFDRERSGMALGWTTGDSFRIETTVSNFEDPATGDFKPEIYVSWTKPHYIYEDVEFEGRYSVFGN